jgi:hypothetical protein
MLLVLLVWQLQHLARQWRALLACRRLGQQAPVRRVLLPLCRSRMALCHLQQHLAPPCCHCCWVQQPGHHLRCCHCQPCCWPGLLMQGHPLQPADLPLLMLRRLL